MRCCHCCCRCRFCCHYFRIYVYNKWLSQSTTLRILPTIRKYPICLYFSKITTQPSFLTVCTHTYSPHKIISIVTSGNVPFFSAYFIMVSLYCLNTQKLYGYLVTLFSQRHYKITISPPVLQLLLYVTHLNI